MQFTLNFLSVRENYTNGWTMCKWDNLLIIRPLQGRAKHKHFSLLKFDAFSVACVDRTLKGFNFSREKYETKKRP